MAEFIIGFVLMDAQMCNNWSNLEHCLKMKGAFKSLFSI